MPEVTRRDDQPFEEFERQPEPAWQERGRLSRKRRAGAAPVIRERSRPNCRVGHQQRASNYSGWKARLMESNCGVVASADVVCEHRRPCPVGRTGHAGSMAA